MDHFAVIADIHGNVDALTAVLAEIDRRGIARIVNLGDHASGPLAAAETMALLRTRPMQAIRGNHDRYLTTLDPAAMGASDAHAHAELTEADLAWLRALPATLAVAPGILACHGTPEDDEIYLPERVDRAGVVAPRPAGEVAQLVAGQEASLVLCGHTHLPRRIDLPDGTVVLNPGSVGCPAYTDDTPVPHAVETGTPAAAWAEIRRGPEGWRTSVHHVLYDATRMIALAQAAGRPEWARALATGRIAGGA